MQRDPGRKFLSISRVVSKVTSEFLQRAIIAFVSTVIMKVSKGGVQSLAAEWPQAGYG